nr:MAG TPA: hypothetical protein [Bacteriophage sp.]DAX07984.1 MAG TPA: hypothetical protein [Bacteriophage sp.]
MISLMQGCQRRKLGFNARYASTVTEGFNARCFATERAKI